MSSALRRISQVPKSIKFLRAVNPEIVEGGEVYTIVTDASMQGFLASAEVNIESLTGIHTIVLSDDSLITDVTTGMLVRDMGRRVTIKSAATMGNPLLEVWIQVQAVNGPTSEGVPDDYDSTGSFWIRTWSADAASVQWARIG